MKKLFKLHWSFDSSEVNMKGIYLNDMQNIKRKNVCCQVGRDVPACLQEALTRKGLDVRVAALVRK